MAASSIEEAVEQARIAGHLWLDLCKRELQQFPLEICTLTGLKILDLRENQIQELPEEIENLTSIEHINLGDNSLTSLPPQIGKLKALRSLRLMNNRITQLPDEIQELDNLTELDLRENALPIPPEILDMRHRPRQIIAFYMQHAKYSGIKKPLNEAKMLIVGQGSVGKTSIARRILGGDFNPDETKTAGIQIKELQMEIDNSNIKLNIWDFGGQEIMHATHQFFLTKRSLYVLVLDSRLDEQENRVEYWLKLIKSFGGDSPVIIVCNKSDQHELDIDWTALRRKYPSIKNIVRRASCKTGSGIEELKIVIESEVNQLDHIHDMLMSSWFDIKIKLETMKVDYISYGLYQQMCEELDIDGDSQLILIRFLRTGFSSNGVGPSQRSEWLTKSMKIVSHFGLKPAFSVPKTQV